MKIQLKTLFSLIIATILLLSSLTIPKSALADGMIIRPDPYSDRWDYLGESNQQAFINYEDGLEKMILSIGMEKTSEKAVWIFPVPSEPNKVVIDVVTQFPRLSGEDISKKAKSNLFDIKKILPATQIYPIPFIDWWGMGTYKVSVEGIPAASLGRERAIETDVIVHEHLEKEGITTEIITARTAQALYQYLQNKNLKVEEGSIPVLDYYIGKEFTFVVSWIWETATATPKAQSKQRGVFVTFPTKEIYYPLLPTSVYGSKVIPVTIRIIGHRSPKIFKDLKNYTKTEYFIDSYVRELDKELKNFYNGPTKNLKYTKIEIEAPSKFLIDDLWISPRRPLKTYYSSFIAQHALFSGIFLLILSSMITSMIVGWILFRDLQNKNGLFKLALVGLSNCLSIIGLVIATVLFRTKAKDENVASLLNEIRQKGYILERRVAVILFFIGLSFLGFMIGSFILVQLLQKYDLPILYKLLEDLTSIIIVFVQLLQNDFPILYELLLYEDLMPLIIVFGILFLGLSFILFLKTILKTTLFLEPEDKSLFAQLKSAGYSSWSFQPKDKMKFIFVPLFSVSFLAISWLIIKLTELTV
jgi:hypothetical protein